jgi:short-subunit dehydrogenase
LSGRNEENLLEVSQECQKAGAPKIETTIGDLRESSVAKELVEHTVKQLRKIDVLVNAAGILLSGTVLETSLIDYDKVFDVNVRR